MVKKIINQPLVKSTNKTLLKILFLLSVALIIFLTLNMLSKFKEKKRVDELIHSIQNEILMKQCNLDKMYCCNYKDKKACDTWAENNCIEDDGSPQIDCRKKVLG